MYEKGRGVPQDYSVAVKWYFKAAEQGDAHAQHNLGVMYEKGRGVSQDYVAAHMWINLAVSRFAPGERRDKAVNERDIIAKHMTPAQITVAQRLARDWQPSQRNVEPLPIAVPAFQGSTAEEKAYGRKVTEVITDNLQLSGLFHAFSGAEFIRQSPDEFGIQPRFADWRLINAQALVTGRAELTPDGLLVVEFRLWDVFAQQQLKGNRYRTVPENWQEVAHKIADEVYQRIVGSATPRRAPGPANRQRIDGVQRHLASLGYDPGPADGILGPKSRAAIRAFQAREGLPVTGVVSDSFEAALRSARRAIASAEPTTPRALKKTSSGSGFFVSAKGHVLTNEHVAEKCQEIRIAGMGAAERVAEEVSTAEQN